MDIIGLLLLIRVLRSRRAVGTRRRDRGSIVNMAIMSLVSTGMPGVVVVGSLSALPKPFIRIQSVVSPASTSVPYGHGQHLPAVSHSCPFLRGCLFAPLYCMNLGGIEVTSHHGTAGAEFQMEYL